MFHASLKVLFFFHFHTDSNVISIRNKGPAFRTGFILADKIPVTQFYQFY